MEELQFIDKLNRIKEREDDLWTKDFYDKYPTIDSDGRRISMQEPLFLCYLIFAEYNNLLQEQISEFDDIPISIQKSNFKNKKGVLKLWNKIKIEYPFLRQSLVSIRREKLYLEKNTNNDRILVEWAVSNLLFKITASQLSVPVYSFRCAFDVISLCQDTLNLDLFKGNILISSNSYELIKTYILKQNDSLKITIFNSNKNFDCSNDINLLKCYFDYLSGIDYLSKGNDKSIFPFQNIKFDGVIYSVKNHNSVDIKLSSILDYVKDGGFCIASNLEENRMSSRESFEQFEFPIMFDCGIEHMRISVCRKIFSSDTKVRYAKVDIELSSEYQSYVESLSDHINKGINYVDYQELDKIDFLVTDNIGYGNISRKPDQMNFIWKSVKDIIKLNDSSKSYILPSVDDDLIVDNHISSSPFSYTLPRRYYLSHLNNNYLNSNDLIDMFHIKLKRKETNYQLLYDYDFKVPEKYEDIFLKAFDNYYSNNISEIEKLKISTFRKMLCCRTLTSKTFLLKNKKFYKVKATKEHPVCFEELSFYQDEPEYGGYWNCTVEAIPVTIDSNYDEDFISFQYSQIKEYCPKFMLVAPTKKAQHAYYLKKKNEFILNGGVITDEDIQPNYKVDIKNIGFTNFRRFQTLDSIDLSDITILVGSNNSGKSTLVKGLLLVLDNIKTLSFVSNTVQTVPVFRFDANEFHDLNVNTFKRALYKKADDQLISFKIQLGKFVISIAVRGDIKKVQVVSPIDIISITDTEFEYTFLFDYRHNKISVTEGEIIMETNLSEFKKFTNENIIVSLIKSIATFVEDIAKESTKNMIQNQVNRNFLYFSEYTGIFREIANEFNLLTSSISVEYIYAHSVSQDILYNTVNKNDYMAKTIHEFCRGNVQSDKEANNFVKSWMKRLEIGFDYHIQAIEGEAYTMDIIDSDSDSSHLANKGMGSIQLMILLMKIGTFIVKYRMSRIKPLIVIEEPEQNLHPGLQSSLALLFYEVNKKYGFKFVIETHSEYLVRRTQVLVAEKNYSERTLYRNPFKVYYFPQDSTPYDMIYRTNGKFQNEFGKGFFDEAANLAFEIF